MTGFKAMPCRGWRSQITKLWDLHHNSTLTMSDRLGCFLAYLNFDQTTTLLGTNVSPIFLFSRWDMDEPFPGGYLKTIPNLASFEVIPRIPHPSLVCPDHPRASLGPGGPKNAMIEKQPKYSVFWGAIWR